MDEKLVFLRDTFKDLKLSNLKYRDLNFELELSSEIIEKKNIKSFEENSISKSSDISKDIEEILDKKDYLKIKAPLVGLFYSKPDPKEDSFVHIGKEVKKGDVLCILEAMKMFNEVKSPVNGIVKSINFKDEDLVSVDDVLFEIEE